MRLFAVIIFILAQAGAAHAETYYTDIGDRRVNLEVPDGYCALMGEDENESRLMDLIAGAIEGVATFEIAFADCGQLRDWKAGRRVSIEKIGYIASGTGYDEADFPSDQTEFNLEIKKKFSQIPESEFGQTLAEGAVRAQSKIDEMELGVRVGQTISLGYLGHDSSGSYIGVLQKVSNDQGLEATMAVISSMLVVQNRLLIFYLAEVYSGDVREIERLLEKTKQFSSLQHQVN